jgi:DNA (cytosine-5)-methyltransferase 1
VQYNAVDLFSGCGGMTEGLIQAGFKVVAAVEIDKYAAKVYRENHDCSGVKLFEQDIRTLKSDQILKLLGEQPLHLLVGCPPCQGFSSLRRRNKKKSYKDPRNSLILEYLRFVEELQPITIMLENVPGIVNYSLFKKVLSKLNKLGYNPRYSIVDIAAYGIPQRRKRLVLLGSLLGKIDILQGSGVIRTVRDCISNLESVAETIDNVHKRYSHHSIEVMKRIQLIPHNGGSRNDLPIEYTLKCHNKSTVGYSDVYGRLKWDEVSSTITSGCLNPSKGRFLHPEENRCITAREAAMLQSFSHNYKFPDDIPLSNIALMIGNAIPPVFCKKQSLEIIDFLDEVFMPDIYNTDKRSDIVKKVKNRNTTPEIQLRKLLSKMKYHYRLTTKTLYCKPDIIFPSRKKVIFVNGCFWHGHSCNQGHLPETNKDFWREKIFKNISRDNNNYHECEIKGWIYLVIWQCEFKLTLIDRLETRLLEFLS